MIRYYCSEEGQLKTLENPVTGGWISLVSPTSEELNEIADRYLLDIDVLKAALDLDERSRIDADEDYTMILVNIPSIEKETDKELYGTVPFSIIICQDMIITVCSDHSPIIQAFELGKVRGFYTQMKSRFILQLLYQADMLYLHYLKNIDKKSDAVETKLHRSTQNSELIELLKLEKSLVYFTTALRSNEVVLEKLLRTEILKKYPEDSELLEDVIVENKQALEMANIYSGILSGMMDAFASVISNNLNIVMKFLAIVTIVLSIPTIIFSAYGMNMSGVGMPFSHEPWGFGAVIGISLGISAVAALIFAKMKMFK